MMQKMKFTSSRRNRINLGFNWKLKDYCNKTKCSQILNISSKRKRNNKINHKMKKHLS